MGPVDECLAGCLREMIILDVAKVRGGGDITSHTVMFIESLMMETSSDRILPCLQSAAAESSEDESYQLELDYGHVFFHLGVGCLKDG